MVARQLGRWAAIAGLGYLGYRAVRQRREADLRDRVVLITGGSRGLGLLLAEQFALEGAVLVLVARDEAELVWAGNHLVREYGATIELIKANLADPDEARIAIAEATVRFGRIDVLVNNAGSIQVGPIETMHAEDFEAIMAINFWAALHTTLAVLPQMRARRSGQIVNIGSIGGRVAVPHLLPYACAKFALRGFSEGIAAEVAKDGIDVTTILPGLMRTGSALNAYFKGDARREFTWFAAGDALPLTAMSAERAARRILQATKRRERVVTLSWQAKAIGLFHDLAPGLTVSLLGLVNRGLPHASPGQSEATLGREIDDAPPIPGLARDAARTQQLVGNPSAGPIAEG